MKLHALLSLTAAGLHCPQGDFYIDPQRAVHKALITHGHSDHARGGSQFYLTASPNKHILRCRLGRRLPLETVPYGESLSINGVQVSFHPAGHILGSSQIRLEYQGDICVVSGDYALAPDPTCAPFEPVRCQTFITETTFGLPIYRWQPPQEIFRAINAWWAQNAEDRTTSIIFAYSLGKAQRILAGVDASIGPLLTYDTVEKMNSSYRMSGVELPETIPLPMIHDKTLLERALIVAPGSANIAEWIQPCAQISTAFASGWMQLRHHRRNTRVDRGFVLSDHADWAGLLSAVEQSGAETVWAMHGYARPFTRWLREKGVDARSLET